MIECINITKSFGEVNLFESFSYRFNDKGLYILYGPSGSGKTTLFNILLGNETFNGFIRYDKTIFKDKVSFDFIQEKVAFITQNVYFIDYLTMKENMSLASNQKIDNYLKIFEYLGIKSSLGKYPNQLSGGEKQRFAIAASIIKKKTIFFFDEPTSSLDKDNKIIIFDILKKISDKCLVICATHDSAIFKYSNNIINFNELRNNIDLINPVNCSNNIMSKEKINFHSIKKLFKNMCKQIWRKKKMISIIYIFFFLISLLLCFACTDYEKKAFSSLVDTYHTNSVRVDCSLDTGDYCKKIMSKYNVSEIVYHYIRNIPIKELNEENQYYDNEIDFQLDILSLPINKELIYYADEYIKYGSYFSNKNQVIIGYDKALELFGNNEKNLKEHIGDIIKLRLPDGEDYFEIVGILNRIDKKGSFYFTSILGQYDFDSYYYLNGKYLEKYLYDDIYGEEEVSDLKTTSLTAFFNDKYDFLNFYNDYSTRNDLIKLDNPINHFVEYQSVLDKYKPVFLTISISIVFLSFLFYYQLNKTEILYTYYYYSVYQYFGYNDKEIKCSSIIYNIFYIVILFILSFFLSFIASYFINTLITYLRIIPFNLLKVDYNISLLLLLILLIFAFLNGVILNHIREKKGWYKILIEESDLL